MNVDEIIKTKEFFNFYDTASDYCNFIEDENKLSWTEFLQEVRKKLMHLYNTALELQWVELQSNIEYDEKLDNMDSILLNIANQLDDKRYYWHVYNPVNDKDTEPVCGDLVDDLGDIYKDLKFSLMIYNLNKEDCQENALWQFKFDFETHWNDHCMNALNAVHFFLQDE